MPQAKARARRGAERQSNGQTKRSTTRRKRSANDRKAGPLGPPTVLKAGRTPIDVDTGHAAPFVADLDGDGRPALLVGQFGDGKLRIYRNSGTKRSPRLDPDFSWLRGGRKIGKVPFG